ncbi:MAG: tripartite tricarboxylate transporter TctB family protein [Clostridia bacterium]|nr:tripartite tricarboxylate transporter TctB family protein [Clostridia bacterium]MBR6185410.1 tripartite tricarboxylate transporter TctB family protein [Clostridia bacterium]
MFELICNVFLFVFLGYTYFTHVLEAKVPKSYLKNPNVLHPSVWPKAIIILLLICIAINIVKIIKKNKGNPDFTFKAFGKNSLEFLKSRMFIGMVVLVVASFILEPLGFVVTAALLMFAYGMLLGEKKWWRLAIVACVLAVLLHIAFSGLLGVSLPRGTVPFLRSFSLFLENLF